MVIYLHLTSRKIQTKKHRQTKSHDHQIPIYQKVTGSRKNKMTNNNNKYINKK